MVFAFTAANAASTIAVCDAIIGGTDFRQRQHGDGAVAMAIRDRVEKIARYIDQEHACVGVNIAVDSFQPREIELLDLFSIPREPLN